MIARSSVLPPKLMQIGGRDVVTAPGERAQHPAGVGLVGGLAEDLVVHDDDGVGRQNRQRRRHGGKAAARASATASHLAAATRRT